MPKYRFAAALALSFSLVFASGAIGPTAFAQLDQLKTATQQELDVIKVLLKQEAAWNRGDIDAFAEGYKDSPDTLFLNNQVQRGYAGMLDAYHHNYPTREAMGTLSFSELEVHPLDEKFAVCIGKYQLDRNKKSGGNAEGLFSLVFEKTDKGWKIVVDHTT
jgi:ketosteroid isomerase-like protein